MQDIELQQANLRREKYQSIDQVLGLKENRYFGIGFKRVNYQFGSQVFNALEREMKLPVAIRYPDNWSRKSTKAAAAPHLSSLDAMLLNCFACEYLLTLYFELDAEQPPLLVRRVDMRAGAMPQETLDAVPLVASLVNSEKSPHEFYRHRTTLQVKVGGMTLETVVEHSGTERDTPLNLSSSPYHDIPLTYFDECLRGTDHRCAHELMDVALDFDTKRATGRLQIRPHVTDRHIFLSPIEAMLGLAQLAQALIYRSDNLDRSESETLWMRSVLLENFTHFHDLSDCLVTVWLESAKTLRLRGDTWRVFRMLGEVGSSRCVFSIAHKLPANHKESQP